jgi:hypothetical protein
MHHNKVSNYYYGYYENGDLFSTINTALRMYEEVKPREWFMNVSKSGNKYIYDDFATATSCCAIGAETIKVREVLD